MVRTRTRTDDSLRDVADGRDLESRAVPRGNLPLETTSFVGRERELVEVDGLLGTARLLTLVGVGGSGKTRLALRVAADLAKAFDAGAWWVDLASLSEGDLVPRRVASALGMSESPGYTTVELLVEYLGSRETLLVLDNCEHLLESCASLADVLLRICPGLRLLATSREPLGVAGEVSWHVPPLSLPDVSRGRAPGALLRCEAVRLFFERANAVAPGFALTEENGPSVADLCARLDGMPLAIELAASRIKMLSASQILERLDDRFRLLRGSRTAVPRHRTLRATIDWSYDLLSEKEKVLLRRLSVFAKGWTLSAAEEVCAGDGIEYDEVFELLSCLVDKSLVVVARGDVETHYRMLETVRQYASEKLDASAEEAAVRRRHADYFLALAERAKSAMTSPEQTAWLYRLEREHDNLEAALRWLGAEKEAERGLRMVSALMRFWWFRGYLAEGRAWLERLLDMSPAVPVRDEVRAKALHVLGALISLQADFVAGDWTVARLRLEDSLGIYQQLGSERRVATVLQTLGHVKSELGEWEEARSNLEESLEVGRRSGDENGIAHSLCALGVAYLIRDDFLTARALFKESLAIFRGLDDKFWIAGCLFYLGYIDCEEGEYPAARSRFLQMNEELPLVQFPWGATHALEGFARLAAAEGQPDRALRLGGATAALWRTFGVSIGPTRQAAFARGLEPAWDALRTEKGKAAVEEGRTMTLEEALAYALAEPEAKPDLPADSILTAREVEVLSLVAEGLSDAQAAQKLYVSPRTVGGHLRGTYRKLRVKSRTAAVKRAEDLGLI